MRDAVVLVTGAASGLGAAACRRFADEGAAAVPVDLAFRERDGLVVDVTDERQVDGAVERVLAAHGRLDALVNCAGVIGPLGPLQDMSPGAWRRTLEVNLTGTFLTSRAALPAMLGQGGGQIVNFASSAGVDHSAGQAAYNASKAGVISLTKTLAREVHGTGVRANAVCPGNVDTPLLRSFMDQEIPAEREQLRANQRAHAELSERGMVWNPADVMDLVVFLASAASSHLNGQFLRMATKADPGVYH